MTMLTTAAAANVANVVSLPSAAAASVVPAGCRQAGAGMEGEGGE